MRNPFLVPSLAVITCHVVANCTKANGVALPTNKLVAVVAGPQVFAIETKAS